MANATAIIEDVEVIVTEEQTTSIELELTVEEASALRKVLDNVGGYSNGTRGLTNAINTALKAADVEPADVSGEGSFSFKDGTYELAQDWDRLFRSALYGQTLRPAWNTPYRYDFGRSLY